MNLWLLKAIFLAGIIVAANVTIHATSAWQADRNLDRMIDADEFALLEGLPAGAPLPEQSRKRFERSTIWNARGSGRARHRSA